MQPNRWLRTNRCIVLSALQSTPWWRGVLAIVAICVGLQSPLAHGVTITVSTAANLTFCAIAPSDQLLQCLIEHKRLPKSATDWRFCAGAAVLVDCNG